MTEEPHISVIRIGKDLSRAVERLFVEHELARTIAQKPDVYIKVNAVDAKPFAFTSPQVVSEVILQCKNAGAKRVFLMDNSSQGIFTRLVFEAAGFTKLAKEAGAIPLYLDEGRQIAVELPHMGYSVRVSAHIDHISRNRESVTYINLPRLKTHSMTVISAGIKNQYGFLMHRDRSIDHNWKIHKKIADILSIIRPDFTLVDGTVATAYGHYPPAALHKKSLVPLNILVAGRDVVSVDVVCARILGYKASEVKHIVEAWEMGFGPKDLDGIKVSGDLSRYKKKYPYSLYDAFPPDVQVYRGRERCCLEGCDANTMALVQLFYLDHEGRGGFSIVMGKGHGEEIKKIRGRVFIAGGCAYDETYSTLTSSLGKKNVLFTRECNDLAGCAEALCQLMRVSPLKVAPLSPFRAALLLGRARLRRTTSRIPRIIPG